MYRVLLGRVVGSSRSGFAKIPCPTADAAGGIADAHIIETHRTAFAGCPMHKGCRGFGKNGNHAGKLVGTAVVGLYREGHIKSARIGIRMGYIGDSREGEGLAVAVAEVPCPPGQESCRSVAHIMEAYRVALAGGCGIAEVGIGKRGYHHRAGAGIHAPCRIGEREAYLVGAGSGIRMRRCL